MSIVNRQRKHINGSHDPPSGESSYLWSVCSSDGLSGQSLFRYWLASFWRAWERQSEDDLSPLTPTHISHVSFSNGICSEACDSPWPCPVNHQAARVYRPTQERHLILSFQQRERKDHRPFPALSKTYNSDREHRCDFAPHGPATPSDTFTGGHLTKLHLFQPHSGLKIYLVCGSSLRKPNSKTE